jgi:glycolate oxidase iron-sulfur subunit
MVQVAEGKLLIGDDYVEHIGLCLACRACETACPSGVEYGRLVEAARAQIAANREISPLARAVRSFVYGQLLVTPGLIQLFGYLALFYQRSGLQWLARKSGVLKLLGRLGELEQLTPPAEYPFFFERIGKRYPAKGERKYRVAFLAGCIANVSFARLNEATVRVLTRNGCDVVIPAGQNCCGALHVHAGLRDQGRTQARTNIEAVEGEHYDAIITNAAGCGSTLKEYADLFEHDPEWHERAEAFSAKVKDVNEFLAAIELNTNLAEMPYTVTYQDSCHLLHGQKLRTPPRKILAAIPGLRFRELPLSEICCGSAGVYNVEHTEMAMELLQKKMQMVETTGAEIIVTANPGCMLQLRIGAQLFSRGQRVSHVVELLDAAYRKADSEASANRQPGSLG